MPNKDIIVVGASAGSVEALAHLVSTLPADLPAAVFVVLHLPSYGSSVLPDILSRRGPLPALHPADGDPVRPGRVYVAPPDHHLLLHGDHIHLSRGPSENGHRPAVDTLFRSAARWHGPRAVGVVLTGTLDDGTAGLLSIHEQGGTVVVQDPADALFSGMPRSALEHVPADFVLPLARIGPALARIAATPAVEKERPPVPDIQQTETAIAELDPAALETPRAGQPSAFACPECHGVLWEVEEGELVRFRCRTGHAYSPDSLLAEQFSGLEDALWTAFRALEENAALCERMQARALERGSQHSASRFAEQAAEAHGRAAVVRQALEREQINAANAHL